MNARIYLAFVCLAALVGHVCGQCTFFSTFGSSSWHDNTKGTVAFGTTTATGWWFKSVRAGGSTTISSWQCVNSSDDTYLVMRTQSTFSLATGSGSANVYAYLCMRLTKITDVSYYYYLRQVQQLNLGGERLKASGSATLTQADVCDDGVTVPTPEFHVLVKSGSESLAAVQCPDSLLFSADYVYYGSDGTVTCNSTSDVWNACTNTSEMIFDYSTCSQQIMFSAGGKLLCIFSLSSGYVYTVVYNQDTVITSGLNQFACLSVEGNYVSVAPGNCTATQTPYAFPKEADQTTSIGHRLVVQSKYVDCGPVSSNRSEGLADWEITLIVLAVLYFVFMCTLITALTIVFIYAALVFLVILLHLTGTADFKPLNTYSTTGKLGTKQLTGLADFKPGTRPELPPLNISTAEKLGLKNKNKLVPSILVTTPTDIHVKTGGPKGTKNGVVKSPREQKATGNTEPVLKAATSQPNIAVHPKTSPRKNNIPHTSRS